MKRNKERECQWNRWSEIRREMNEKRKSRRRRNKHVEACRQHDSDNFPFSFLQETISFSSCRCWNTTMNNPIAQWYYCRQTDKPGESPDKWIAYRDFEVEIIERAYQANHNEVFLDKFRLDLVHLKQNDLSDSTAEFAIFRREACLRDERFFLFYSINCRCFLRNCTSGLSISQRLAENVGCQKSHAGFLNSRSSVCRWHPSRSSTHYQQERSRSEWHDRETISLEKSITAWSVSILCSSLYERNVSLSRVEHSVARWRSFEDPNLGTVMFSHSKFRQCGWWILWNCLSRCEFFSRSDWQLQTIERSLAHVAQLHINNETTRDGWDSGKYTSDHSYPPCISCVRSVRIRHRRCFPIPWGRRSPFNSWNRLSSNQRRWQFANEDHHWNQNLIIFKN